MEGQIASTDVHRAVEKSHCSEASCEGLATAGFEARPLCAEHFLARSLQELDARSNRLKSQPYDAAAIDSFKGFLSSCVQEAKRLSEGGEVADTLVQSRLFEFLARSSDLGRRLRRSPRVAASVAVWLRREDPGRTWEEATWTSTLSRYGAGLECRHSVEAGGTLVLCRRNSGGRVRARVVYSRFDSQGRRQIGLELLDQDDFWGLTKNPRLTGSVASSATD